MEILADYATGLAFTTDLQERAKALKDNPEPASDISDMLILMGKGFERWNGGNVGNIRYPIGEIRDYLPEGPKKKFLATLLPQQPSDIVKRDAFYVLANLSMRGEFTTGDLDYVSERLLPIINSDEPNSNPRQIAYLAGGRIL